MICQKCGDNFAGHQEIDGKWRNLQNRKFCLVCSPFGKHNTCNLLNKPIERQCVICLKKLVRKSEKGKKCWVCTNRENRKKKLKLVQELVGTSCWICGYDKIWGAMDLHHVFPETKAFQLTTREMQFTWGKIETELRKCALLCCRCHREYHLGLIDNDIMIETWKTNWANTSMVENPA